MVWQVHRSARPASHVLVSLMEVVSSACHAMKSPKYTLVDKVCCASNSSPARQHFYQRFLSKPAAARTIDRRWHDLLVVQAVSGFVWGAIHIARSAFCW
jgi:hypothetical protein